MKTDSMTLNERLQAHYDLSVPVTDAQVKAEVENLRRRGLCNLDDSQHRLATALIHCHGITFPGGGS